MSLTCSLPTGGGGPLIGLRPQIRTRPRSHYDNAEKPARLPLLIEIKFKGGRMWLSTEAKTGPAAMIICSCNVISDNEVEATFSAPQAPRTMSQVHRHLGHEPHRGRCARTIRDIMKEDGKSRRLKQAK